MRTATLAALDQIAATERDAPTEPTWVAATVGTTITAIITLTGAAFITIAHTLAG